MEGLDIHAVDVLSSWRAVNRRVTRHRFMNLWFGVLLLAFIWVLLKMFDLALLGEGQALIAFDPGTMYLLFFFLFMAKSVAETKTKVVGNQALVYLFTQPINTWSVLLGKLWTQIVYNLTLVAMAFGVGAAELLIFDFQFPTNPWIYLGILSTTVLASTSGFAFQIFNTLRPFKKRLLVLTLIPQITIFYFVINYMDLRPVGEFTAFTAIALYSLGTVLLSGFYLMDSWNIGTAAGAGLVKSIYELRTPSWMSRLSSYLEETVSAMVRREFIEKVRTRDVLGTVITVSAVSGGIIYAMGKLEDVEFLEGRFDYLLNPIVIGIGIYIAAVLEPGISSLTAVGREGKNLWLLKTSPIEGWEIAQAKAIGNLWPIFLIIPAVGIVDPLWVGYGGASVLFSCIAVVAMTLAFTGIGTWFGARYPNYEESMKGNPDIVTMYIFSMICLFVGTMLVGLPFLALVEDRFLGVIFMVLAADAGLAILYLGTRAAGREFDRSEANF